MTNVCGNLNLWNWCAIAAAVMPGFLNLIFSSFMLFRFCSKKVSTQSVIDSKTVIIKAMIFFKHQHESEIETKKNICNVMWDTNNKFIKFLNIIILVALWTTAAASTHVDGAQSMESAATIFMWVVGFEMLMHLIVFAIGIVCNICIIATGTVSLCCQACHNISV